MIKDKTTASWEDKDGFVTDKTDRHSAWANSKASEYQADLIPLVEVNVHFLHFGPVVSHLP